MKYKDFCYRIWNRIKFCYSGDIWIIVAVILLITGICFGVCAEERRVFTAEQVWSGEAARIIAEENVPFSIKNLKVGKTISYQTAQDHGIGKDMKEVEELLIIRISDDKMQIITKRIKKEVFNENVTTQELLRDYLQEEIRRQKR